MHNYHHIASLDSETFVQNCTKEEQHWFLGFFKYKSVVFLVSLTKYISGKQIKKVITMKIR